jgi:hypothetical protein
MRQSIPSAISADAYPVCDHHGVVRTSHGLASDALFDERSIAALVSASSPQSRQSFDAAPAREIAHLVAGADGHRLLDDVRSGVAAHVVCEPERYDLRFDILLDRLTDAHKIVTGSDQSDREMVILIAGRNVRLKRGVSGRNLALWMVSGGANVTLYPRRPPFITLSTHADDGGLGALRREVSDVAGDGSAFRERLAAGQMMTWAQHTPHEICFRDALNIIVVTSNSSPESRRINRVLQANSTIARWTGRAPQSAAVHGVSGRMKSALALFAGPDVRDDDNDRHGFALALPAVPLTEDAPSRRLHGPAAN